ncbi:uncharacterized protein LOC134087406 [Sardina pilchardus]|uniref:uncharacterized protein LOC134087406 n=1 Tax=Sardina pilchardus TaxID=27697 RepID=UPI002E15DB82
MIVEMEPTPAEQHSENELLCWLNQALQAGFTKVEQTCSGAAFCQLMDLLFPGSVNMDRVNLTAQEELDILHNYSLLQVAFRKKGITKTIPVETLIQGKSEEALSLLLWFKGVFNGNCEGQKCSSLKTCDEEGLGPLPAQRPKALTQLIFSEEEGKSNNSGDCESAPSRLPSTDMAEVDSMNSSSCSAATLRFIRKHASELSAGFSSSSSCNGVRATLGHGYPKDIAAICAQTPYCLYLYVGVELGEQETGNVILIGFFDQTVGSYCLRILDVIQPMEDTETTSLIETLDRFDIPVENLTVFYSNLVDRDQSSVFTLGLKAMQSSVVSLCGLVSLTAQACHEGLTATGHYEQVLELIRKMSAHNSSSVTNDTLKQLFSDLAKLDTNRPLTMQSLLFTRTLGNISSRWSTLTKYFGSQKVEEEGARQIHSFLVDRKLRLMIMFLSFALQPLAKFQEILEEGSNFGQILNVSSGLIQSYTSSFLQLTAIARYLRKYDDSLLKDAAEHLPIGKVKVGHEVEDFLSLHKAELTELLDEFHKNTVSFYAAVTSSIVKSLPLSTVAFVNMAAILKPEGRLEVTSRAVTDTATQMGLCKNPEEVAQLTDDFLEYQLCEDVDSQPDVDQHWKGALRIMGKSSMFRKLILSFMSFPRMLKEDKIFAQVFQTVGESRKDVPVEKTEEAPKKPDADVDDAPGGSTEATTPQRPQRPSTSPLTDVVELSEVDTEEEAKEDVVLVKETKPSISESIVIDDLEEEDMDDNEEVILTDVSHNENLASTPNRQKQGYPYQDGRGFEAGDLVWGNVTGYSRWPGEVLPWRTKNTKPGIRKVKWFGDGLLSRIHVGGLHPFSAFAESFCHKSLATLAPYKAAILQSLQTAAERCGKIFSLKTDNKDELLRQTLDWAFNGFMPSGPEGLKPLPQTNSPTEQIPNGNESTLSGSKEVSVCLKQMNSLHLENGTDTIAMKPKPIVGNGTKSPRTGILGRPRKYKIGVKKDKAQKRSLESQPESEPESDFSRDQMIDQVLVKGKNIEDFCLSCGTAQISIIHPLFEGSLCLKCKDNFTETLYRYDEDGYQSYCTVCCAGLEVILCGNRNCCRSYCVDCLNILVGAGTFDRLKEVDPWICYLCEPSSAGGALKPREDWSIRVQAFFANDSGLAFEPHRVYPSVPASQRRPLRVLSLFDGIATGYLVLKDLGFKVDTYVASEIDDESISVSMVNHDGKIVHKDDVRTITKDHIAEWGPFDLLIGGSPCNDLSIVNPARKGLFEGTGRLFFEFYRVLNILRPKEDDPKPFFWLFENVSFMSHKDKTDICRFLECNPVLIDAVKVSPAHRARCFWGNLPGMNRPIIASQNDKLTLQECLEIGRIAKVTKVRTITTRSNSLKQGPREIIIPVIMNGKDDNLWITELEKIFGFPKHYTDVRNMGRQQRQKVLGKSWSVPVIRHLFAPLKDYFACYDMTTVITTNTTG